MTWRGSSFPPKQSLDGAPSVWSKISNALKRLGFRSRNFLAQLLSETSRACTIRYDDSVSCCFRSPPPAPDSKGLTLRPHFPSFPNREFHCQSWRRIRLGCLYAEPLRCTQPSLQRTYVPFLDGPVGTRWYHASQGVTDH